MLKCIYAIFDAAHPPHDVDLADAKGLDGAAVYALPYRDIAAAVSDLGRAPLTPGPEVALQYESIIERLMARYCLLPMRFGTLVRNDAAVMGILQKHYPAFIRNLKQVKDRVEYGLKLLWDVERIKGHALVEVRETVPPLNEDSPPKKYLRQKLQEHRGEEALRQKAERVIETIHPPLKALSACSKAKTMITPKIIFDAAYLVATAQQETFIQTVQALDAQQPELEFLLTGPWPPYNFIENL